MNEENNLSIGIRARLLPVIEGSDALKAEISNLPTSISSRMQETISSPAFQQGLSTQQIRKVEHLAGLTDTYEFEKIQERQKEMASDLQIDLDRGKLTLAQQKKHLGRFAKYGQSMEGLNEFVSSELDDPRYNFLSPAQKTILRASATQGTQEAIAGIGGVNEKFEQINYANEYVRNVGKLEKEQFQRHKNLEYDVEEGVYTKARGQRYLKEEGSSIRKMEEMQSAAQEKFAGTAFGDRVFKTMSDDIESAKMRMQAFSDEIEKAGKNSGNLLDNLKAAGVLTLAGSAINMGLDYWVRTEQIKGAERTSFDFSNPMSMYGQQKQFEAFKTTTERTRDYEIGGAGIGLASGLGLAALAGVTGGTGLIAAGIAGMYFGSTAGGKIASGKNIETQTEMEEQLKRRQEVYSELSGMVSGSSQYDILRARTRARIGADAIGSLDLGYMPEEELGMRNTFADARGKYDPQLYKEQTTFARAKGIDPDAIYGLNVSARMTGQNVGISGLEDARKIATATYGENVTSQRIVDVLNDLKNINERMLDVNMNMDSREAAQIGLLPSLIFGKDSPFGRMGDKAAQGLSAIETLGRPGSPAEDAWLYNAYGGGDLNKFAERKKLGIVGSLENFNDISRQMNRDFGGDEWLIERRLHATKDSSIPTAGMIPDIAKMIAQHPGGLTEADFSTFMNDPKFKAMTKGDYDIAAGSAVSPTEKNRVEQQRIIIQIGDDYRSMINKMSLDWLHTWSDLSTSTGNRIILENQLNDVLGESIKRFKEFFLDGGKSAKEFEEWKKREEDTRQKVLGKESEGDQSTKKSLQRLDEKFRLEHSNSYNGTSINDAHGTEATGWVREKILKLQKELSESALGGRYRVNLLEGYDPTGEGHAPGSPHYRNLAADVQVYDKFAHEKISKGNYPKEIKDFFHQFAAGEGISYGGDWTRPDENHFQEKKGNANFDPNTIRSAIVEGFRELARGNNDRQETRIVVEDRTHGGISAAQSDRASYLANSIQRIHNTH